MYKQQIEQFAPKKDTLRQATKRKMNIKCIPSVNLLSVPHSSFYTLRTMSSMQHLPSQLWSEAASSDESDAEGGWWNLQEGPNLQAPTSQAPIRMLSGYWQEFCNYMRHGDIQLRCLVHSEECKYGLTRGQSNPWKLLLFNKVWVQLHIKHSLLSMSI